MIQAAEIFATGLATTGLIGAVLGISVVLGILTLGVNKILLLNITDQFTIFRELLLFFTALLFVPISFLTGVLTLMHVTFALMACNLIAFKLYSNFSFEIRKYPNFFPLLGCVTFLLGIVLLLLISIAF